MKIAFMLEKEVYESLLGLHSRASQENDPQVRLIFQFLVNVIRLYTSTISINVTIKPSILTEQRPQRQLPLISRRVTRK